MKKILKLVLGLMLLSCGVVLFVKANIGADPVTILFTGIANVLGITIGLASQIVMAVLITLVFIIDKKRLGFGTLVHAVLVGVIIDMLMLVDVQMPAIISYSLALIMLSSGLAFYISADLGQGALDSVMMLIVDKSGMTIRRVRIIMDASFVVIGILLGAKIGVGSFIAVLLTGPFIQMFLKGIKRLSLS